MTIFFKQKIVHKLNLNKIPGNKNNSNNKNSNTAKYSLRNSIVIVKNQNKMHCYRALSYRAALGYRAALCYC